MLLLRLAINQFRTRRVRALLTILVVALSVSLVVSVTSGYSSLLAAATKFLDVYLGSTDAQVYRKEEGRSGVPEDVVRMLRDDPRVRRATGRLETDSRLVDDDGKPIRKQGVNLVGIRRPGDDRVETLRVVDGKWFDGATGNVAVIDQGAADVLKLGVGDVLHLPSVNAQLDLEVVAIVHKPGILAGHILTVYLPLETLQKWVAPESPPFVSRVMLNLADKTDPDAFVADWGRKLEQIDPNLKIRLTRELRKDLDRNLRGIEILSMMGGAVSMVAATFIVFSSLSMGVSERQRTLAMMRAIGAFRGQIGGLVVIEGMLLATAGVALGVPLGWLWLKLLSFRFDWLFSAGVVLSTPGVLQGVVGSLAAALAASLLPAFSAMRVDPLEAMSPLARPSRPGAAGRAALAGLALAAIDLAILALPWTRILPISDAWVRDAQFLAHFFIGIPTLLLGFFLLSPIVVVAAERTLGPLVARLFGLQYTLLRQQLSGGVWRSAGTATALMVGLAVLVVMQVQGRSMLGTWRLPDKFPDVFVYSRTSQMRLEDMPKVQDVEGIREVMPITLTSPQFGSNIFAIGIGMALLPDATMFFGVDPDKGLEMMDLEFKVGDKESARQMLKKGRHLIVTEEFRRLKGLTVGDKIPLKTAAHGTVDYTIAGVVWSPGIDVIVGLFDLGRQFEQRTVSSVFGTIEDSQKDFGVNGVYLFAANLETGVAKDKVLRGVKRQLGTLGLDVGDIRQIKAGIQDAFGHLLTLASTVAFAAMAVSSLGVTNTIMASIRSRQWQFGILRSIGVTRSQLLRLVLAEAVLLGFVACALGLAAGLEMSFNARNLALLTLGLNMSLVVPWRMIAIGVGAVLIVAVGAGALPATLASRKQPLDLLQAGRAAG